MPTDMTSAVLAGKYRLESLIGRGGMGSVWRAEHLGLRAPVAVKLMDVAHFGGNTEALARFQREAFAAATIRSAHVVQIFDHGFDEALGVPFIVMELMTGESLAQRLARGGPLAPAQAAQILTHVARALTRAHDAGIVHRDLKPDNVFLVRNEDEEIAKVLDFGIARAQGHDLGGAATATGTVMGTAYYMSPEQISGAKNVDYRSDLWAFGVMACECLTGIRPFQADSVGGLTLCICIGTTPVPSRLGPVPAGFDAWFTRCVQRDPEQRFQSAREAAEAFRELCGPNNAQRPSSPSEGPPPATQVSGGVLTARGATDGPLSVSSSGRASPRSKLGLIVAGLCLVGAVGTVGVRSMRSPIASPAPAASESATPTNRAAGLARVASEVHDQLHDAVPSSAPPSSAPPSSAPPSSAPPSSAPPSSAQPSRAAPHGPATGTKQATPTPTASQPKAPASPSPVVKPDARKSPVAPPAPTRDVIDDRH